MQPIRSRLIILFAALAFLLAIPSCTETSDDAAVEVEIWTLALGPFESYLTERFEAFEQEHPGVRVKWVDVPFDQVSRKLIAATAAGRSPDIVNLSDRDFARFASLGAFADLDVVGEPLSDDHFLDGAESLCQIGGHRLAYPWYLSTQTVMANAALLETGGLSLERLPTTWRGLLGVLESFHASTGSSLVSVPLGEESLLPAMLLAEGIPIFRETPDGIRSSLATAEGTEFVSRWVEAYRSGWLPREAATAGHAHLIEGYQSGSIAVINTGANFLGRIRDASPSIFETTDIKPAITGDLGRAHIATMVLGVSRKSDHPDLAARLAAHLTSPESQLLFCRLVNILPSTGASLEDPLFSTIGEGDEAEQKIDRARMISAGVLRDAVAFTPALETWPDLRRAFDEGIKSALLSGADVEQTLRDIDAEWDRLLAAAAPASMDAIPMPEPLGGQSGGAR